MKSIRTTTIALVGTALLTLGALTGCSSDSDDTSSDTTTASDESNDSGDSGDGDSKDGGSGGVDTEFCTPYESMSSIDMADYDALIEFWEGWKDSAPSDVQGDFDVIIDTYQMAKDGDMTGYSGKVQELTDATTNITDKVAEVCS